MSIREQLLIEMDAARVAADADNDLPSGDEHIGVFNGWLYHEIDRDPYSRETWIGWLAREIYETVGQCDRSVDERAVRYGERCARSYGHTGRCR